MSTEALAVRAGGAELYVRTRGHGRPLLLLHGLGGGIDGWSGLDEHLAGHQTIEVDPPGIGRSPVSLRTTSIPAMAELCVGVLDELDHRRVDVLGYSWGGLVAQQLAAAHPGRVRRLCLVSTSCGVNAVPGSPLAVWTTAVRQCAVALWATVGDPRGEGLRRGPTFPGLIAQLCAVSSWSTSGALDRIEHPSLVVTGDRDELVPPANSRRLAGALTRSRLEVIGGAGHDLLNTHARQVGAVISDFLDEGD